MVYDYKKKKVGLESGIYIFLSIFCIKNRIIILFFFLNCRHGRKHDIHPSSINFRANIHALKEEGCTHVVVTTACGSLQENIHPGDVIILDQFIDRTTKRVQTFYDGCENSPKGVCHIPMHTPFCPEVNKVCVFELWKLRNGTVYGFGCSCRVQVDIPKVFILKGFYSEGSLFQKVYSKGSLLQRLLSWRVIIPKGFNPERSFFWSFLFGRVVLTKIYPEGSLFQKVFIPKGRYSKIRNNDPSG